jgi:hypothetical protein
LKVRAVEFLRTPRCAHLLGRLARALVRQVPSRSPGE